MKLKKKIKLRKSVAKFFVTPPGAPPVVLMENGDFILMEDGVSKIKLE